MIILSNILDYGNTISYYKLLNFKKKIWLIFYSMIILSNILDHENTISYHKLLNFEKEIRLIFHRQK